MHIRVPSGAKPKELADRSASSPASTCRSAVDGRIAALHLRLLGDDRQFIPPYDTVLQVPRSRAEHPAVWAALRELAGRIDQSTMQRLNLAVDEQHRAPSEVARAFSSAGAAGAPR